MLGQVLYKKTKPNLSQSYLTQGKHLSWFEEVKDLLRLRIEARTCFLFDTGI